MHRVRHWKIFSSLLLSSILLLTMFGCAVEQPGEKPTIRLAEFDWTSQIVLVEILDQIISEQLGYPTERIHLSQPATWPAMDKGEVDLTPEIWFPVRQPEIQPFLDKGNIELAGVIYPGGAGWCIPRYVVEGDAERGIEPMAPDLKSIMDLQTVEKGGKGYWKLFENPENPGMAEVVGGPPGWLDETPWIALGYDLPVWESHQTDAVMWARTIAAVKRGKPIMVWGWWPHWIFAAVDLIVLEDVDPHRPELIDWDNEPTPVKTGFPVYVVHKVIRVELKDTAPDVYRLVHGLELSEDEINAVMLRVDEEGEEMSAVAADWISQNQDKIDQWLGK